MSNGKAFAVFGGASFLLFIETRYFIPFLTDTFKVEPIVFWFLVAGLGMFLPLLVLAALILKSEGWLGKKGCWENRMRFRTPSRSDWLWTAGAIVVIGILGACIMEILKATVGSFHSQPAFMTLEPLDKGRYWLLALWLPYWVLNIMGEEILWRGVLLPRQEIVNKKWTWVVHGCGWLLFHAAFGWLLLITLLPIIFVQSYVVQKRQNSWLGVIIHGGINGPAFLAIAFGAL